MANLIGSLRLISTFDWSEFFESVSLVEQVLQRDPAGVYGRMDFRSRDRYRHAVEELAEPTGDGQLRVALKSVERARQVAEQTPDARGAHVGYYLIGRGRRQFEKGIGWVAWPAGSESGALFFRHATPGYLGTIASGTAALVAAAVVYAYAHGWRGPMLVVGRAADARAGERADDSDRPADHQPPDSAAAAAAARSRSRARLGAHDGHRADASSTASSASQDLIAHLEVQALGNLDPHIHFAILSDFRDAPAETLPRDAEILAAARAAHRRAQREARRGRRPIASSSSIASGNGTRRKGCGWDGSASAGRSRSSTACCAARPTPASSVQVGDLSILPQVRYCITLDSDTRLPRDAARQLIGIITHPLNRPSFDPAVGPRHRGLRHPAAARQRHVHERRRLAVRAAVFGPHRRRPVHDRGLRHLSGSVRRRHLHRQGPVRRRRLHRRARGLRARERAAVARPVRRAARPRRARVGRGARRRISVERAHARPAPAPLDSRRLADSVLAVSVRPVALTG